MLQHGGPFIPEGACRHPTGSLRSGPPLPGDDRPHEAAVASTNGCLPAPGHLGRFIIDWPFFLFSFYFLSLSISAPLTCLFNPSTPLPALGCMQVSSLPIFTISPVQFLHFPNKSLTQIHLRENIQVGPHNSRMGCKTGPYDKSGNNILIEHF